jgi:DNA-binding PadR family transcriptional regulator
LNRFIGRAERHDIAVRLVRQGIYARRYPCRITASDSVSRSSAEPLNRRRAVAQQLIQNRYGKRPGTLRDVTGHTSLTELATRCIVWDVSLNYVLLGLLAIGDRHGYELKQLYDKQFPHARPLASAQVYSTLSRLAKAGHVEQGSSERVGGPDRIPYSLTSAGRSELNRWLEEVEPPSPFVANPLAFKVTIAALTSGEVAAGAYLQRQRAVHLARMRQYTRTKTDVDSSLAVVLAADYAIEHLNADLHWIETALARIGALTKEIATP